jgi:hypothetical protein
MLRGDPADTSRGGPGWFHGGLRGTPRVLVTGDEHGQSRGGGLRRPGFTVTGRAVIGAGPRPPSIFSLMGRSLGISYPAVHLLIV